MKKIAILVGGLIGMIGLFLTLWYLKPIHGLTDQIAGGILSLLIGGYMGGCFGYLIYGLIRGFAEERMLFAKVLFLQMANCFLFAISISPLILTVGILGTLIFSLFSDVHFYIFIFCIGTLPMCVSGFLFAAISNTAADGASLGYVSKRTLEEIKDGIYENSPLHFYPRFFKGVKNVCKEMRGRTKKSFA